LKEARSKASSTAKEYVPKLYHILVDEEHKTAEDARDIVQRDLLEYWAKETVRKFIPQEVKDEQKVIAGKAGKKAQMETLLLTGGRKDSGTLKGKRSELETDPEKEYLADENKELKARIKKLEEQSKAGPEGPQALDDLPPEMQAIAAKQVQRDIVEEGPPFRVAIVEKDLRAARDLVMRELTKLKGGGWKVIEVRTRRIT
jgi:hypothetical protein